MSLRRPAARVSGVVLGSDHGFCLLYILQAQLKLVDRQRRGFAAEAVAPQLRRSATI